MTRKGIPFFTAACLLFFLTFSVFSQERQFSLGGKDGWSSLSVMKNIIRSSGKFGYESLMLKHNSHNLSSSTDLLLDFDNSLVQDASEHYTVVSGEVRATTISKIGNGAALFTGKDSGLRLKGNSKSFFGKEGSAGSFTIEFWLYPSVAENGESLFSWRSSRNVNYRSVYQMINASFFSSHIEWRFSNIFSSLNVGETEIVLKSDSLIIPSVWAHHSISFDEQTGLLEYKINGRTEDLQYITSNKKENGSVYTAILGGVADIEICPNFTGAIDDFRISRQVIDRDVYYDLYPSDGGRFETQPLLLSSYGASFSSLEVLANEPAETAIHYFIRAGNNFYDWTDTYPEWISIEPNQNISGLSGIYFQLAAVLYSNGAADVTPSVAEIKLNYTEKQPPLPPYKISSSVGNGFIDISWNGVVDDNIDGYLLFYGNRSGEYMSQDSSIGPSPVDVGKNFSTRVSNLRNGKIYYFAVASYTITESGDMLIGDLSQEVYGRPSESK